MSLTCAVPRLSPAACSKPATFLVTRDRGRPIGTEKAPEGSVREPACEDCAKYWRQDGTGAHVEPITDEGAIRALYCKNGTCESGALGEPDECWDCRKQREDQQSNRGSSRYSEL